jgi:AraC-like DNA-binding protein
MEYTIDNILKECDIVVYEFQNSTKKRLRPMLDKRNYLIAMLYYKFGYTEEQIATIFSMSRTTVSVSKLHTYSLLEYGDNIFKANVSEYLINYPYDFPSFSNKFKKDVQIIISFDTKTLKKIRAYRDVVNENTTAKAIKRLVTNGLQLWEK